MKIRALLIGSSGEGDSYLLGVKKDVRAMKNYLLSGNGGGWKDNEITVLEESNPLLLNATLRNIKAEENNFVFVSFFGHGSFDECNGRKFYLDSNNFFTLNDINGLAQKQIFIADSCAKITSVELSESFESRVFDSLDDKNSKRLAYINWLSSCDNQQVNLFGCNIDEYSNETDKGGYFTQSLIDLSNNSLQHLSVIESFELAQRRVQVMTNGEQNPTYHLNSRPKKILPFKV